MNKFENELAQLNSELMKNNSEAEKVRAEITFFEIFNETATRKEILDLIKAFKQKKIAFDCPPIQLIMPARGFFETIFGLSESNEERQKKAEAEHKRCKDKLALEIAKLDAQIKAGQALIERHKSLNEYQLRAMIKTYECREEILQGKIQSVSAKCEKLQQAIGPLLENAAQYRQQVRECEDSLKACQAYSEQLAIFHDAPSERRKVHESCAKQFNGNGRPSDVAYDLNKKLESTHRQLIKVEDRIDNEIKKIDIVVKRAFIDGNNLCFKRNQYKDYFIGTKAVEAVATALLQKGMEVTVVFDHYIGKGKDCLSFDRIQQNFKKEITVNQSPPDTSADLVLMMMARDKFDCVISNDKFIDHGERSVVKEMRVFRAVVTDSVVSVPMLNVEVSI